MDMNKKKAGFAILCCALMLTLGTGFAFAANAGNTDPQGSMETSPFAYKFKPDPQIYLQYSSYGIAVSDNGEALLYNGQRVRLFVDEHSKDEAFFLDEAGILDLNVIRNSAGNITSIEQMSERKAQEYRSAFFEGDTKQSVEVYETVQETVKDIKGGNKYEQYSAYGIRVSKDDGGLYYNGQRVRLLVDKTSDGNFETFWTDEAGSVNLSVVRNSSGQITAIESMTEEQAQKYQFIVE